jgi:hypothetical protein
MIRQIHMNSTREGSQMRKHTLATIAAFTVSAVASYPVFPRAQAPTDAKAATVLAEVRKALGGEQKIAAVKALALRADYRREISAGGPGGGGMMIVMRGAGPGAHDGGGQTTGKIEIDVELPDKYLRSDIGAQAFGMTRTDGYEGTRLFQEMIPNSPGMQVRVDNPAPDATMAKLVLTRRQHDLARLFLGLTGKTQPGFDATYTYGGQAESPDGKADIIDVTGPEGFKARLFVDAETHLPLMLTYLDAEPRVMTRTMTRGGGPGAGGGRGDNIAVAPPPAAQSAQTASPRAAALEGLTPEQREEIQKQMAAAQAEPPKMVEYRLFFAEYQKVDGVSLPHQISRGMGGKTTEEWTVTSYRVNPTFKADRFKVGQ